MSRLISLLVLAAVLFAACSGTFSRKYEYDEDLYVFLDGTATLYLNASIPALVALRGLDLDADPRARFDRAKVRAMFESPVTRVASLTTSRRDNRRYAHLRINVSDVRRLHEVAPFAWSRYSLQPDNGMVVYQQTVGASAAREVGDVGWGGHELVAFRLHLPSAVTFHNAPSKEIERGNIIRWEQPLTARIRGDEITMQVRMEAESILVRTLILFAITVALAALTFATAIWWVLRRKPRAATPPAS